MESKSAVTALSALAHETRLTVFRVLVQAGPDGVAAGDLARSLNVVANTMSAHLSILAKAGLITSRRDIRRIIYSANYNTMSDLMIYLMEDCCQGRPEVCVPLGKIANRITCCDQIVGDVS